jgi:hypothetical protein
MLLFCIYLGILSLCSFIGIRNFKYFAVDIRIICMLIIITFIEESLNLVISEIGYIKAPIYHFYSIIEISFTTSFFLKSIKVKKILFYSVISLIFWSAIGIGNIVFLQPISVINTNMLVIESISIIIMAQFALYKMFLNDNIVGIIKYPSFWIWAMFLIYWSCLFFFWGFLNLFHDKKYHKFNVMVYEYEEIINIIVYLGIGLTFLFYPKKPSN